MRLIVITYFIFNVSAMAAYGSTTVDFDAQAAGFGSTFTGISNSPLTIGGTTFIGGELLWQEAGSFNQTGVYATEGVFGNETNPVGIQLSSPVDSVSLDIWNGDAAQSYTIADNLGDTQTVSIPSAGADGFSPVNLTGNGIEWVTVSSANANGWNFAIDDVSVAQTPEPASMWLMPAAGAVLSLVGGVRKLRIFFT